MRREKTTTRGLRVIAATFVCLAVAVLAFASAQDVSDCPEWSFYGDTGPVYWGELCDAYTLCATGNEQSPINVATRNSAVDPTLSAVMFEYKPLTTPTPTPPSTRAEGDTNTPITLAWTGNPVDFRWPADNHISKGPLAENTDYKLLQVRFHAPSITHYEDEAYPLELHLIHQSENGQYAVVSILYDANDTIDAPFLSALYTNLVANTVAGIQVQTPDLVSLVSESFTLGYYTVMGSLPVPPCTENVVWITAKRIMLAPRSVLNSFGGVLSRRARPVQALEARVIREYHPPQDSNQVAGVLIALSMVLVVVVMAILFIVVVRYKMKMGIV